MAMTFNVVLSGAISITVTPVEEGGGGGATLPDGATFLFDFVNHGYLNGENILSAAQVVADPSKIGADGYSVNAGDTPLQFVGDALTCLLQDAQTLVFEVDRAGGYFLTLVANSTDDSEERWFIGYDEAGFYDSGSANAYASTGAGSVAGINRVAIDYSMTSIAVSNNGIAPATDSSSAATYVAVTQVVGGDYLAADPVPEPAREFKLRSITGYPSGADLPALSALA